MIISEKYFIKLKERKPDIKVDSKEKIDREIQENVIEEKKNVTQGKLVIGLNVKGKSNVAATSTYNAILGGGANSNSVDKM